MVRAVEHTTGHISAAVDLPSQYFGEGMTFHQGKLIQLTWKSATGFVYDANNLAIPPISFQYETTKNNEGWGITWYPDRDEFIVSDGSSNLVFWDSSTYEIHRIVPVTRQNGAPATRLNELEYWRGRVLANVYYEKVLLVINPESGTVEKEYGTIGRSQSVPQTARFNSLSSFSATQQTSQICGRCRIVHPAPMCSMGSPSRMILICFL